MLIFLLRKCDTKDELGHLPGIFKKFQIFEKTQLENFENSRKKGSGPDNYISLGLAKKTILVLVLILRVP